MLVLGPVPSCCCSLWSRSSTLSVSSFRGCPIPLSFTGCRLGWGGSYPSGQHTSLRSSQVLSGSTCIKCRKTLWKTVQREERRVRTRPFGWHLTGLLRAEESFDAVGSIWQLHKLALYRGQCSGPCAQESSSVSHSYWHMGENIFDTSQSLTDMKQAAGAEVTQAWCWHKCKPACPTCWGGDCG